MTRIIDSSLREWISAVGSFGWKKGGKSALSLTSNAFEKQIEEQIASLGHCKTKYEDCRKTSQVATSDKLKKTFRQQRYIIIKLERLSVYLTQKSCFYATSYATLDTCSVAGETTSHEEMKITKWMNKENSLSLYFHSTELSANTTQDIDRMVIDLTIHLQYVMPQTSNQGIDLVFNKPRSSQSMLHDRDKATALQASVS